MSLEPGQKCPTCERKVPHERRESSPETRVVSYRVPSDEYEAHLEVRDSLAEWVGASGRKFETFWSLTYAMAAALQDASLQGVAAKAWTPPTTDVPDWENA